MHLWESIAETVKRSDDVEAWKIRFDPRSALLTITQELSEYGTHVYEADAKILDLDSARVGDADEDGYLWLTCSFLYFLRSASSLWKKPDGELVERRQFSISIPYQQGKNSDEILNSFREFFAEFALDSVPAHDTAELLAVAEALQPVLECQLPSRHGKMRYKQRVLFDRTTLVLERKLTRIHCGSTNHWFFPLLSGDEDRIACRPDEGGFNIHIPCLGFLETCVWTPPPKFSPDQRTEKGLNIIFPKEEDATKLVDVLEGSLGKIRDHLLIATRMQNNTQHHKSDRAGELEN